MLALDPPRGRSLAQLAALAAATALAPAPPSPEPPPRPAPRLDRWHYEPEPGRLELLDPGTGDRIALRYTVQGTQLAAFSLALDGITVRGTTTISAAGKLIEVTSTIDDIAPRFDLIGSEIRTTLDRRGVVRELLITRRGSGDRASLDRIAFALSSFERLPDAPVASGARWQETLFASPAHPRVARTRDVSLISVTGPTVELHTLTTDHADSLDARGRETRTVELSTLTGLATSFHTGTRSVTGPFSHSTDLTLH